MIRIDESVEVAAAAARAFAFVTRIEDYPAWLPGVVRAEAMDPAAVDTGTGAGISAVDTGAGSGAGAGDTGAGSGAGEPPLRVGARFRLVSAGPGGVEIVSTGRVAALDPPHAVAIEASSGFFRLAATCTVEPLGESRSRIGVTAAIEPRGLATLAAGRIEQELRASLPETFRILREAVERPAAG
jgi:carbon monoxide dehydrogenase subunit G